MSQACVRAAGAFLARRLSPGCASGVSRYPVNLVTWAFAFRHANPDASRDATGTLPLATLARASSHGARARCITAYARQGAIVRPGRGSPRHRGQAQRRKPLGLQVAGQERVRIRDRASPHRQRSRVRSQDLAEDPKRLFERASPERSSCPPRPVRRHGGSPPHDFEHLEGLGIDLGDLPALGKRRSTLPLGGSSGVPKRAANLLSEVLAPARRPVPKIARTTSSRQRRCPGPACPACVNDDARPRPTTARHRSHPDRHLGRTLGARLVPTVESGRVAAGASCEDPHRVGRHRDDDHITVRR